MGSEETTKPNPRPARAKAHLGRHKRKYITGLSVGSLVVGLQFIGALGPLLCHLPFVHDVDGCVAQAQRAAAAAQTLDSMKLDAPGGGQP
jgi:hypothetical protein